MFEMLLLDYISSTKILEFIIFTGGKGVKKKKEKENHKTWE